MSLDNILLIPGLDWTPRNLFRPGDNGLWQDMSNFGTLRQLSAGSTLVSSVGDPIGYIADSGPRGHLTTQTTNGKRPILSRTPEGGVRQLLNHTGDLTNAAWVASNSGTATTPVVTSGQLDPDGGSSAFRLQMTLNGGTTSSDRALLLQANTLATQKTFSIFMKSQSGTVNIGLIEASSSANVSNVSVTEDWAPFSYTVTAPSATSVGLQLRGGQGNSDSVDVLIWHPQLEKGSSQTAYQQATTRYNITEAGKRDCWAYGTDGIDDAISTPSSVDMSGSDEMTVCVGLRKLSDAAIAIESEFSINSGSEGGAFSMFAPVTATGSNYLYRTRGTATVNVSETAASAPISNVILGESKISTPIARIFKNGVLSQESSATQGTGNYGNHRLYFAARAETSLFFQGLVYQRIIINRLLTDYEKTKLQQFVARKMGITL